MPPRKTIKINCDKNLKRKNIDEMQDFQGELKVLTDEAKDKLKNSIIAKGFRIPIFMWKNKILDGHQRIEAITSLVEEDDYNLPKNQLPYVEIPAKNEKEAKEMLLLISSQYGAMTEEGVLEFLENAGINYDELKDMVDLPSIDESTFDDIEEPEKPEVEFTEELLESHNYVVLYFDNDIDWMNALSILELETVKALDSKEGYEKKGVGRVINGVDAIQKIKEIQS